MYVAIDGDDSGRKITACYINNDEAKLRQISEDLERAAESISKLLRSEGFRIVFCAADGVAAETSQKDFDFERLFENIQRLTPVSFTFSVGAGDSLQEAYVALLDAKCSGKDKLSLFSNIKR